MMWIRKEVFCCRKRAKHENTDKVSVLTFDVELSKLEGVALGAALRNDNGSVIVSAISASGSIREWNEQNPEKELRPGDKIVAVNNASADFWGLVGMLWKVGELKVSIERDQTKELEVVRRKSRVYLKDEDGKASKASGMKLTCPVDDFPHMSAGDCSCTECAICFEDYEDPKTRVVVLPCSHVFHPTCAARWFTQGSASCPLCKQCICPKAENLNEVVSSPDMSEQGQ